MAHLNIAHIRAETLLPAVLNRRIVADEGVDEQRPHVYRMEHRAVRSFEHSYALALAALGQVAVEIF